MNEQRIIDLETKVAHQEYLLSELNQVIARQQESINTLQVAVKSLLKNSREGDPANPQGAPPVNEKPPHY